MTDFDSTLAAIKARGINLSGVPIAVLRVFYEAGAGKGVDPKAPLFPPDLYPPTNGNHPSKSVSKLNQLADQFSGVGAGLMERSKAISANPYDHDL